MAPDEGMPNDPISELAAAASQLHELFISYVNAGFNERQALYLVGQVLRGASGGGE